MSDFDVSASDVQAARDFLTAFLAAKVPGGDFSRGGVIDDLLVGAHGPLVAYLLKQVRAVRDRQSLLTLANLPPEESAADAADALLDNLFASRGQGAFARGRALVHLTQRVDCLVGRIARFFRTQALVYYPDAATDVFVPASALTPNVDASGRVVDYTFPLDLVAARVGKAYNAAPGRFVTADRFSPFLSYVEHVAAFAFGDDVQSTPDFVAAARNAMSLRALVNGRSNDALLRQVFPAIKALTTIGYGDPEMTRDLVVEAASGVRLHVGGKMDLYARLDVQTVTTRLTLGALADRADGRAVVLRDTAPPSGSFVAAGVAPGDVLVVASGIPEAPAQFVVDKVTADELWVSKTTPFSVATDASATPPALSYTVGDDYPGFADKLSVVASTTATTSARFAVANGAVLPGGPLYRVARVQVVDPPPALAPYLDPATGTLAFAARVNAPVLATPAPGATLGYQVVCENPGEAQSGRAIQYVVVGWPAVDLAGLTLEVTYDTLAGFDVVDAYVADRANRPGAADTLARGQHPVYLAFTVPYRLSVSTQLAQQSAVAAFSEAAATLALVDFVNAYDAEDVLDYSLLASQARAQSTGVASVYPFTIDYELASPDGRVYRFQTDDTVTVFPDGATSSARLLNPADFGLPATGYYDALRRQLLLAGVSDRTLRYLTSADEVAFLRRS